MPNFILDLGVRECRNGEKSGWARVKKDASSLLGYPFVTCACLKASSSSTLTHRVTEVCE